ncbi:MAG TPA: chorismate mutase [Firmicutes bacterium]|nr:chorismate mutase [Bacillota bacterium]
MALRGVRGAVTVPCDDKESILHSTADMLRAAIERNGIRVEDIAAILFAVTQDLTAAFPAEAARKMGLDKVPLLDFVSPGIQGAMNRVIRMMILWNTPVGLEQIHHVYLGEAARLRPDLSGEGILP